MRIQFDDTPDGLIFKDVGMISKIERKITYSFRVKLENFIKQKEILRENAIVIMDICLSVSNGTINCELLQKILKLSVEESERPKPLLKASDPFGEWLDDMFGTGRWFKSERHDQVAIDSIRREIQVNRDLIKNQTQLMNETIQIQNEFSINVTNELRGIKKELNRAEKERKMISLIQDAIMMIAVEGKEADTIAELVIRPSPLVLIQLLGENKLKESIIQINKTLENYELLANNRECDVKTVLKFSELSTEELGRDIGIIWHIPVTSNSWKLYEIFPISNRKGGEVVRLYNINSFMAEYNGSYTLMNSVDLERCYNSNGLFTCSFSEFSYETCESQVFYKKPLRLCQYISTNDFYKLIRVSERIFFINTVVETSFVWGCMGPDQVHRLSKDAWVFMEPGCHIKVDEQVYNVPARVQGPTVERELINFNTSLGESADDKVIGNFTDITGRNNLVVKKLDDHHRQANESVEIQIEESSSRLLSYSIVGFSSVLIFILCTYKKFKIFKCFLKTIF